MSFGDVQNILENVGLFRWKCFEVCGLQMSSFRTNRRGSEINVCLKTVIVKIIQRDSKRCAQFRTSIFPELYMLYE